MNSRIPLQNGSEVISPSRDSYVILRLLSDSGGSALTYHAVRKSDGQLVVLKELYPLSFATLLRDKTGKTQLLTSEQQKMMTQHIDTFSAEAAKNQLLQKEFGALVVPDSNAKLAPDYAFISSDAFEATNGMWYIEVFTGQGECLNKKNLSITTCIDSLLKLCKVVEKLHSLGDGYLHLDLKPENIFITSSEELKLLDFGSMLPIRKPHQEHLSYSPGFSAPELYYEYQGLLKEKDHPSTSSDCYSVTAIFYWMLFGVVLAEEKMLYTSEIDLRFLKSEEFPEILRGYSYKTIDLALSILRKGLSFYPDNRYQTMTEIRADLQKLLEMCQKDDEDISPVTNADGFIKRIANIDDFLKILSPKCVDCVVESKKPDNFRGCCLACELLHAYIEQHLEKKLSEIEKRMVPAACIASIDSRYVHVSDYRMALFCFRFLHKKTDIAKWQPSIQDILFNRIKYCCHNLCNLKLLAEYPQEDDDISCKEYGDLLEEKFDFDGMVQNVELFLYNEYGEKNIQSIRLKHNIMDEDLIRYAGQLAEAICLQQAKGWAQKAYDIMVYVLNHIQSEDDGFMDRSVDNLLHFAVENRNPTLFLNTLVKLSKGHSLYKTDSTEVGDWIKSVAESFSNSSLATAGEAYPLYLFLKSLNILFTNEVTKLEVNAKTILNNMLIKITKKKDLFSSHPGELVLKHMGLLSQRLETPTTEQMKWPTAEIISILKTFANAEREKHLSLVTLIADAALLSLGDEDGARLTQLRKDIAAGVEQKIFCKEYFEDILTEEVSSEELLGKFRFKHA